MVMKQIAFFFAACFLDSSDPRGFSEPYSAADQRSSSGDHLGKEQKGKRVFVSTPNVLFHIILFNLHGDSISYFHFTNERTG